MSHLHEWTTETDELARSMVALVRDRLAAEAPAVLRPPASTTELADSAGTTITPAGIGFSEALRIFREVLAPASSAIDHPRFFAFIPSAPTPAAMLFDLAVAASSIYPGTWLEGAGAVYAENAVLRWLADLAGLPEEAGGCFVPGGTMGNLSALVAARDTWRRATGANSASIRFAASAEAHSSMQSVAAVMGAEILSVPTDEHGRMTGTALADALRRDEASDPFAVVATAGTTNLGAIDDLSGVAAVCRERGLWLHVDGAYGAAALAVETARDLFRGIEFADSLIIDPHKWLFAPFDCCALLYRDPELARTVHTQRAAYLDPIAAREEWNPSDYAVHLSRRARGLPLWFSLASHGTGAYADAIEATLRLAREAAREIDERPYLGRIHDPALSVLAFRRHGWRSVDYAQWSSALLTDGVAFVMPSEHRGETVARIAILNPKTTIEDIRCILDTMLAWTSESTQ